MEPRRIPNKLAHFRRLGGLSQIDAANAIGEQTSSCISRWEQGFNTPSLMQLFRLSCLYETLPHHLYPEIVTMIQDEMHGV